MGMFMGHETQPRVIAAIDWDVPPGELDAVAASFDVPGSLAAGVAGQSAMRSTS
jgi:hypothetical protein